jgi:hypothetical protein
MGNGMILASTPIRAVLRPGNITNTMEVMVGDIEWFSALVKMQAKLRDAGKLVLGLETMAGKSAQDAATTAAAVSAVIPVTDSERTKVDTLIQIEQTALLQSLQLNAVAVGLRALRADPRFVPTVRPCITFGVVQYAEAQNIHAAVRKALLIGVKLGQVDQTDAWFLSQLIQHRDARLELMYKKFILIC